MRKVSVKSSRKFDRCGLFQHRSSFGRAHASMRCPSTPARCSAGTDKEPGRRLSALALSLGLVSLGFPNKQARAEGVTEFVESGKISTLQRKGEVTHSDKEWRRRLSKDAYYILRQAGTEFPFSSPLNREKRAGTFRCAGCEAPVFLSSTKYDSGTGWPSFYDKITENVEEVPDYSIPFYPRTEGHLGHVFPDGPQPTGLRYCMNGAGLTFTPNEA